MTLVGDAGKSVAQPARRYLRLEHTPSAVLRSQVIYSHGALATFVLETAARIAGPWRSLAETRSTGFTDYVLNAEPSSTVSTSRFVRWRVEAPAAATWGLCARVNVTTPNDLAPLSLLPQGEHTPGYRCLQDWVTIRGGYTASPSDGLDFIPVESSWLTTDGMENLMTELEAIRANCAQIDLQWAMNKEGPWTTVSSITPSADAKYTLLSNQPGVTTPTNLLGREVRYRVQSSVPNWVACLRLGGKWS